MAQVSPAKIKAKSITQVAIAVRDVPKVAENYWNILGIGPWEIYDWEYPLVRDRQYYGKPALARERIGFAQVGATQLELIQPVDGPSIYGDFLEEHGEGIHHLQFKVEDVDGVAEMLAKQGFPDMQSGHSGDTGAYHYIDFKPLHTIWELAREPKKKVGKVSRYPESAATSPAKIRIKNIDQVAIVVRDVPKVAENHWNILGIGPWEIYEVKPPTLYDRAYRGKAGNFTYWLALTMVGPVQLELAQPISGGNVYSDFMAEHGEGLHHIAFTVDDINQTTKIMNQEGFPTLMGGGFSDGSFAYYDTRRPLKIILEAFQVPKAMPPSATRYP